VVVDGGESRVVVNATAEDGTDFVVPLNDGDNDDSSGPPSKRIRRGSADSTETFDSDGNRRPKLQSRILHAGELLASAHAPPSPSIHGSTAAATAAERGGRSGSFDMTKPLPKLYQQAAPPQQQSQLALLEDGTYAGVHPAPRWKKRHTKHDKDDKALPFPRDIVGTFSCHGVEPIYDSDDYREEDDDDEYYEDEDGEAGVSSALRLPTGVRSFAAAGETNGQEKPTMAAKINQDRGGVAFPYGNSRKTALFAVYDGKYTYCRFG
jgi:hypothetical protein